MSGILHGVNLPTLLPAAARSHFIPGEVGVGTTRTIQAKRAYNFDGTDDYVALASEVSLDCTSSSTWTICYWANLTDGDRMAIGKQGNEYDRIFHVDADNLIRIHLTDGTSFTIDDDPGSHLGDFMHFALTYDGSLGSSEDRFRAYIDGVAATIDNGSYAGVDTTFKVDNIGWPYYSGFYWKGKISDVRLYSSALSSSQVSYISSSGSSGEDPGGGDLGHWKCDDKDPTVAYDSSGNGNHGTKTNITEASFHYEGSDVPLSFQNKVGYSDIRITKQGASSPKGITWSSALSWTSLVFQAFLTDATKGIALALSNSHYLLLYGPEHASNANKLGILNPGVNFTTLSGISTNKFSWLQYILKRNTDDTISVYEGSTLIATSSATTTEDLLRLSFGFGTDVQVGFRNFRIYNKELSSAEKAVVAAGGRVSSGLTNEYHGYGSSPWTDQVGSDNPEQDAANFTEYLPRDESDINREVIGSDLLYVGEAPS